MRIYPLTFKPILKERIWGGNKLQTLFGKELQSEQTGESWELSTVGNDISIISNGSYSGKLFTELISQFPKEILGEKVYQKFGTQFPLLFKFIDACEDLSIQVHPDDELAQKRHNSFGKTEMWYIIQADKNSRNIIGFAEKASSEQYLEKLKNKGLLSILKEEKVQKGDVFFLETGTVHAIGKGIVLAEIQQTSDITYRIYDWDRTDANGKPRELHLDLALEAINYNPTPARLDYSKTENKSNTIIRSPYFSTAFIALNGKIEMQKSKNSFHVYMCTEGSFSVFCNNEEYNFQKGDTILFPAVLNEFTLEGKAELLEVYL
ncbi:MAG: type I phosphomannose isomerase catalytic subunit [Flavobacteriaceae bacterium]